ncbi:MAG TPA: universal stress protein [Bryobacteraceae bacterium]|nr:universal stress protein [Bryobacteraceae bacterium]
MKILLAVDLSAGSQVAVTEVAMRPWPAGTSIQVIGVTDTEKLPFAPSVVEEILARTHATINSAAERLKAAGLAAEPRVISGDPRTMIPERAKEIGADLVIVGAHSTAGVAGFLLGSVAKAVIRMAHCSVEVARHTRREPGHHPGMRVLLAVDESDFSTAAARAIAARPWQEGTEIRVMSVVDLAPTFLQSAFEPPFVDPQGMEELRVQAVQRAESAITRAREILSDAGLRTSEYLSVLLEDPKKSILDEAKRWSAELIVVGSHGRRGFQRFMIGSVSEGVAMHATCTVEIIRTP